MAGVIGVFTSSSNGLMDKNLKPMYLDFYNTNRCIKAFRITNYSSELIFLYAVHHVHNTAYSLRICEINYNRNKENWYFNSTMLLGESNVYEGMYINDNFEVYAQTEKDASLFILPLCGFNYSLINEQSEKLDISSLTRLI